MLCIIGGSRVSIASLNPRSLLALFLPSSRKRPAFSRFSSASGIVLVCWVFWFGRVEFGVLVGLFLGLMLFFRSVLFVIEIFWGCFGLDEFFFLGFALNGFFFWVCFWILYGFFLFVLSLMSFSCFFL